MKTAKNSRILTKSIAALLGTVAVFAPAAYADVFTYTGGSFTESFDLLGTAGLTTTSLSGAGSLPNDGASPWFIRMAASGAGNTEAFTAASTLNAASTGSTAVNNPATRMFNNGEAGTNPLTDRALGSANTGGDPVIDLKIRNDATGSLSNMTFSFDTEWWRSGSSATTNDFGYLLYFSPTGAASSWTQISYTRPSKALAATADLDGNAAANRQASGTVTFSFPTAIATSSTFYLRFRDDNDPTDSPDANIAIDNFVFTATVLGGALTYNLAHSVGGGNPNGDGNLEVSANQYWLNGASPSGFATGDIANFSLNPATTATINVPADINVGAVNVSNTSGAYSIGGAGRITGPLTKSEATTLTLTSANNVTGVTITGGGTIIAQHAESLGTGTLTAGTGGGTIQTDVDVTTGALAGTGLLTKTGASALTISGTGTATGGVAVTAGKLSTNAGAALGTAAQVVTLSNNSTLEFTNVGAATTVPVTVAVGGTGGTISVTANSTATASGATFGTANTITGAGTLTKDGPGVLRISAAQSFTGNWIVSNGVVEVATAATGLGTGGVALNGGVLVSNGLNIANNITLNGGALGTRTNSNANFSGTVNVTADSFFNNKSSSSPGGYQGFTVSGVLSGANKLTVTGPVPLIANAGNVGTTITNTGNTYSGEFDITSQQVIAPAPAAGTGNVLGTSTVRLRGGALRVADNGTADNGTVTYGNNVIVDTPSEAGALAGTATINVDRQAAGTFTGNTIALGGLTIGAQTLAITGGNTYGASFTGATLTGNATIDNTAPVTVSGAVTGGFGLTKSGAGTLTLQGTNTHTGATSINAGTLVLTGSLATSSQINVGTGALLNVVGAPAFTIGAAQTLAGSGNVNGPVSIASGGDIIVGTAGVGSLSLTDANFAGSANIGYTWNAGIVGALNITGTDTLVLGGGAGSVVFDFTGVNPNPGSHIVVDYAGVALDGTQFGKFTIGALNSRILASLVNNTVDTRVELNVTGTDVPKWVGNTSEWSTNVLTPKNWVLSTGATATDFIPADNVLFDDTATGTAVDISVADVAPTSVLFNNSTANYTLTGSNGITGAIGITKTGTGSVTISNTNSFTGGVAINGGTVSVNTVADSGTNSALGAGTAITLAGGTLEFTGATGTTNRPITINAGGGTVKVSAASALALTAAVTANDTFTVDNAGTATLGAVSGTGAVNLNGAGTSTVSGNLTTTGAVTKNGAGTAILTGAGNTATLTISGGTLQIGDGTAAGSTGTAIITNNATLSFNTPAGGVVVANEITGTGGLTKFGGTGNTTLSGAVANTFTGATLVNAGNLVLSKNDGINAVGGDVTVNAGGTVSYGTTAGQRANHIPDTATVTISGGTFGSGAGNTEVAPQAGIFDTVGAVNISSGTFYSGRGDAAVFAITGALNATGGRVMIQRGGNVSAASVTIGAGTVVDFDGGSTGFASRLTTGAGGISFDGNTVSMNMSGNFAANSVGSTIILGGNLTSAGATTFTRVGAQAAPRADIDLNGADRTFNITGTLTLGTTAAQVNVVDGVGGGDLIKAGSGDLVMAGTNNYTGDTIIQAGKIILTGSLTGTVSIDVQTGTTFDVSGVAGGFTVGAAQTLKGNGTVIGDTTVTGTLSPGASIGALTFNDDLTLTGITAMELNKSGMTLTNDEAFVTGANILTLGGNLNITHTGDLLAEGDVFDLFDAPTFAGTIPIANMSLPTLGAGLFWDVDNLSVNGSIQVIPEPGSAALLLIGGAFLARRRRKA